MAGIAERDVDKLRADTPATRTLAHFNNAGAALPPMQVVNAAKEYLDLEASLGGYGSSLGVQQSQARSRHRVVN